MNEKTKFITTTALMTAVLCILGPISLPIGPVPIALGNFAIFLTLYVLGMRGAVVSVILYILIGFVGLPVFSGFSGGVGKIAGPTGGYIIGYLPMVILAGLVVDRFWEKHVICVIAMEAATWVLYLMGTLWLARQAGMTFPAALSAGVLPFIVLDLIKIIAVALIGPQIKKRLNR